MKFSLIAALALGVNARRLVQRENMNIQLNFANGMDEDEIQDEHIHLNFEAQRANPGVRFVQQKVKSFSDPIKGSLGWPAIPMENLTPEQQFEESQRRMPAPVLVDDPEQVTATLNSIKTAEGITGGAFQDPNSPAELKKIAPTPNYPMADSDDEADDEGDSTVETRRSVQWAENALKQRWFINAQEKRSFEEKVAKGQIRGEVLDFTDKSDNDMSATASEIADKDGEKKEKAVAKAD